MSGLLPGDGALQLLLVHRRAALDAERARLGVQLVARAALGAVGARSLAAAARGRDVVRRGARSRPRLAAAGTLFVDGARRDLLGTRLGCAMLLLAVLDVLVLAGALGARLDSARRHSVAPFKRSPQAYPGTTIGALAPAAVPVARAALVSATR